MRNVSQILGFSVSFLFLSACSGYQGDWPKLSAPLPEKAGRQVQNAQPSAVIRPFDSFVARDMSATEVVKHFQTLQISLKAELKELTTALQAMEKALKDSQDTGQVTGQATEGATRQGWQRQKEKLEVAWGYLNLHYTRLSQGLRSLKDLRDAADQKGDMTETLSAMKSLVAEVEKRQKSARKLLMHAPS